MPSTGTERMLRNLFPLWFVKCKAKAERKPKTKFASMHVLTHLTSSTPLRRPFLPPLSVLTATPDELLYCRAYRGDGSEVAPAPPAARLTLGDAAVCYAVDERLDEPLPGQP